MASVLVLAVAAATWAAASPVPGASPSPGANPSGRADAAPPQPGFQAQAEPGPYGQGRQPELWGYVDARGVAHFADHPVDERYQRVIGPDDSRPPPRRVPGKKDSPDALLMRLSFAPEAQALRPWLREASQRHGVDEALMLALIAVESGFDARAVSPAGAIGLMQIMPVSGERYARGDERRQPVEQRLLDPRLNILTGARMLGDLIRRLERLDLVLAAWNAGEGNVRRHGLQVPPFAETRAHVKAVLELYGSLLRQRRLASGGLGLKLVQRR